MLGAAPLTAETPQDSLVTAFQIDDLITLDPAEVFEFSGTEYAANVYDRRGHLPAGCRRGPARPHGREL